MAVLWMTPALAAAENVDGQEMAPGDLPLDAPTPRPCPAQGSRFGPAEARNKAEAPPLVEFQFASQKLKAQREVLREECLAARRFQEGGRPISEDNARLKLRLDEILARLGAKSDKPALPVPPASTSPGNLEKPEPVPKTEKPAKGPTAPSTPSPPSRPGGSNRPLDPLALAQALFKSEKYEAALRAFRLCDLKGMKAPERLPIQYLTAACLKRQGKTDEATNLYREIANSRGDENLAVCAQWQLGALRWQQELHNQLNDIRRRRKALESPP